MAIFDGVSLDHPPFFHGISIEKRYTKKLLDRLGMKNCNGVLTPLISGTVLKNSEEDGFLNDDDSALYRQIVGSTIYPSNGTRPDISNAVGQLARFMAKP